MTTIVITPPAELPVSLDYAKRQLRISDTDDDELISDLIAAATGAIDGPSGWLGRALITQTLEHQTDEFGTQLGVFPSTDTNIYLPCRPIVSITSVKYDDSSLVEQTISASAYRFVQPNVLGLASGSSWPTAYAQTGAVRIRYVAGYGDADDVPAAIRQAIVLAVKDLYSLGERNLFVARKSIVGVSDTQYVVSDSASNIIFKASERLLAPYRVI